MQQFIKNFFSKLREQTVKFPSRRCHSGRIGISEKNQTAQNIWRFDFFLLILHPLSETTSGKMPEWSIGTVSKTVVPLRVPRVRIPVFPQPNRTKISPKATNRRLSNSSAVFSCLILSIQDRNQTKKRPHQTEFWH